MSPSNLIEKIRTNEKEPMQVASALSARLVICYIRVEETLICEPSKVDEL